MQEIFCIIDPWVYKQQIFKMDIPAGEKKLLDSCRFGELNQTLMNCMTNEQIYNLHLFGMPDLVKPIGTTLEKQFNLNFSIMPTIVYN